jgi:hypothetical protein
MNRHSVVNPCRGNVSSLPHTHRSIRQIRLLRCVWIASICAVLLFGAVALAQERNIPVVPAKDMDPDLIGVIDLHAHSGPDPDFRPRLINDIDLARLYRRKGMRGFVLKNHYTPSAAFAELVMEEVGGIDVWGGVVLNRAIGGLNPDAIKIMLTMQGKRGKIVWLPTWDAEYDDSRKKEGRPSVPITTADGQLRPELPEIFKLIADNDLTLATGHISPAESLAVIPAAQKAGVKQIIVTHPHMQRATEAQMKTMAGEGAILECIYSDLDDCAGMLRSIGAEHFIISSDLGQVGRPIHPDGMKTFIVHLRSQGITQAQIDLVSRINPAKLLGLKPEGLGSADTPSADKTAAKSN